ncbi:MAG TPA: hypothetical protein VML55_18395, partial [Planctomycetaceae bacterium]|nr:hypothetical protein [Planctomycetaceae bacterium]
MSRSLKLSLPGLGLVAVTLCVSGACSVAPGQDERPDPAVTIAEQGGPPVGVATAQTSAAESRHTWDLSARSPAEQRIERALDNPRGVDIEFIDQPLKEAMEYTNDAHGITILLDEKALQDDGIQTDEPLNYVLSGITLRSALNIMLDP